MTKTFQDKKLFGFSNFGHWNLFDIWNLIFGILIIQNNSNKANPLWGPTKPGPPGQDLYAVSGGISTEKMANSGQIISQ